MVALLVCITAVVLAIVIYRAGSTKRIARSKSKLKKQPHIKKETDLTNYKSYKMTNAERIKYTSAAAVFLFIVGFLFFNNLYICLALCLFSPLYPITLKKELMRKRQRKLNLEFNDALHSISSSLSAGRSVEGAFRSAVEDLKILYPNDDTLIIKELEYINRKIDMNETMDTALNEFSQRAGIEDITNFTDVFIICKNTGGNLVEVIKNTSSIINQKVDIQNEIEVILAEKKFSQKILNVVPLILLSGIALSSPDYIRPLYSLKGHVVMFVALLMFAAAYWIGEKIMDIRV